MLSTALAVQPFPSNNSAFIAQTFWLTTTPFVDLSSPDIPLTGCVLALAEAGGLVSNDPKGVGQETCNGVLSAACQQALVDSANNASLANSGAGAATQSVCEEYLAQMPMECGGEGVSVIAVSGT